MATCARTKAKAVAVPRPSCMPLAQIDGLGRDDELDRRQARQAAHDVARLLDDARRHRRVVLDAVGDRRGHGAERLGEMADLGLQRRRRLLRRGEAGARAAVAGEEARQAGEAGDISLAMRNAAMAAACDSARPSPSKASARAVVSKLTVDISSLVVDQHGRAVAGAVEIGVDRRRGARELLEGGAVHRGEAAEGQRVLHAARRARPSSRSLPASSDSSVATPSAWPGRAGAGDHGADRWARGWRRTPRATARRPRQRLQREAGVVQRKRAGADAVGIGIEQRDRVLGAERRAGRCRPAAAPRGPA